MLSLKCFDALCSFFITYDQDEEGLLDQKDVLDILVGHRGSMEEVVNRFQRAVELVIKRDSYFLAGKKTKNIDISAVLKTVPIQWVASEIVRLFFRYI